MPATATCTRWCCSTRTCRERRSGPRRSPGRSSTCASTTAARSPASTGDEVAGVRAALVAAPASVDEAGEVLRVAAAHDLRVVARGGGSKVDWGVAPAAVDLVVDTRRLDRVVEHAAGDMVAVVEAG